MQERIALVGQQALARIRSAWQLSVSGRVALVALSVAAAYYAGAHVGFLLRFPGSPLSIIWPPNAILLAALLLVPTRQWWVVLLAVLPAHLLVEAQNGVPPWTLLGLYLTNCGEALLAAVGVRCFTSGPPWFATVRQVAIYITCAVLVAPFVTSFLDPAVVVLTHWDTSQHYWLLWQERFVSNALTYLTVPPVLLSAGAGWRWLRTASRQRRREAALLALSVLGAAYLVFHTPLDVASSLPALLYAPVPVLLWAALRFGVGGSSAALLGLTLLAATSQAENAVFDTRSPVDGVLALQVFLSVVAASTLLLAALGQERRQTARELRASQARYRDLVETQTEMICRYLPDGRLTFVNDAYCRYFGRPRGQLLGTAFFTLLPLAAAERAQAGLRHFMQYPGVVSAEHEVVLPDGSPGWQHWVAHPIVDDAGHVVEIQALGRDITERKRAEAALRTSRERYALATAAGGVSVWEWDTQTDAVHEEGSAVSAQLGFAAGTARTGAAWFANVHPDDRAAMAALVQDLRTGGRDEGELEHRAFHTDGTIRWQLTRCGVAAREGGRVRRVLGTTIDITARKRADEALRRSETRFQRLADSGMIGLKVDDGEGRIVAANDAFLALVGYSREELAAGRLNQAALTPPDYAAQDARVVEELRTAHTWAPYEKEYVRKDGTRVPVLLGGAALEDEEGMAPTAIFFVLDLSERKRTEEALRELAVRRQTEAALRESEARLQQANAELERASRLKSAFLATMSHELRTPLNGVLGLTSLLVQAPLDARQQEYAAGIQASGEALLALISDILDLSKIEAGQVALEEEPFALPALVEGVVEMVRAQVRAKGLAILAYVAPEVPEVLRGDATRLRQVLANLVGNAVKFTEQGTVVVRVRVAQDMGAAVLLRCSVLDTGIGITPEARASLFAAFTQADSSMARRYGGTGLGLAICKHLVELMGGRIGMASVVGRGSVFTFTVPLRRADLLDGAGGAPASLPVRVLLVGGAAPLRAALHDQLADWGATVTSVAGARAALHAARAPASTGGALRNDVVIVACQGAAADELNGVDGLEMARQLRDGAHPATVPLVLVTASAVDDRAAERAGITAQLLTPIRPAQLYETLARLTRVAATGPMPRAIDQLRPPTLPARSPQVGSRILVAEDNPINQMVTVRILEDLGYATETVEDGRQAVEAVRQGSYALVLMDCHMPKLDGFAATSAIRRHEREAAGGRRTPIVALTADAFAGDAEHCLAAGMDAYLAKPVTAERLAAIAARWAQGRAAEADTRALDPAVLEGLRAAGLLDEAIALYMRETPGQLAALRGAAERAEATALADVAHRLKGSSAQLGAKALAELAGALQEMGEAGAQEGMAGRVDALEQEFRRVRATLEARRGVTAPS